MDNADFFMGLAQQALWITALAAAPILLPALIGGVIIGMIQAATSINEQTVSFVPKLIIVMATLALFGGSILLLLTDFTREIFERIPDMLR
ncbi:flagellar biosynthesis protein FliQ [Sphingobium algorifonticola]|uniref:Flagellar biosynthetic protein FliQ n=1 Tax=Sphingobium algorifonticola TaxID=2008318 RepID=A0A437JBP6_9SPHN|nr:flagellar biosynthesis protein FliQ [Sphingobium algorifonticola]RVT43328.1 flagellar biosynthetic protein FliQ [Sphingobium algorifonticola]